MSTDFVRRLPGDPRGRTLMKTFLQRVHIDLPLLTLVLITLGYGIFVLWSASDGHLGYIKRQVTFAGMGLVGMLIVAQIPLSVIRRLIWIPYTLGLILLVLVFFVGSEINGAKRWLDLGFTSFQPSELMKLTLPVLLAAYLSKRDIPPRLKHTSASLLMIAVPVGLIVLQPDLGTSLLIAASGLVVLFLAGLRWAYIFGAALLAVISAPLLWQFGLHDYQRERIITMFNPEADPLGAGWNISQSMTAIGSGGWSGKGWYGGTQSHLDFLPESHTDFIIAVLAEELGFRGVCILLLLYSAIVARGLWISYTSKSNFSRMVAMAFIWTFFLYAFVNMGMVSGVLPVVGLPLPLISYGGTALLTLFALFGILMAISTEEATLKS